MSEQDVIVPGAFALEAVLHRPDAEMPLPGVVVCHPHPQYGGDMGNNVVMALVDAALSCGIAALRFNFRGVGGSGGAHDGGAGEVDDVASALAYLAGREEIDDGRIALAGYSFGAMMAMRAADERVRALALTSPPMQWIERGPDMAWQGPLLFACGDDDPVCPARTMEAFAAERAARSRVVVGADHSWWGHEAELEQIAAGFLTEHLIVEVRR